MSSLSDSIALSGRAQSYKEHRERLEKELKELWESGTEEQKGFAKRVLDLVHRTI